MTRITIPFGFGLAWDDMTVRSLPKDVTIFLTTASHRVETYLDDSENRMYAFKRCDLIFEHDSDAALFKLMFL